MFGIIVIIYIIKIIEINVINGVGWLKIFVISFI